MKNQKTNSLKPSSIHEDHRKRVRKKISDGHVKIFADHELVEYVLFHAIPRGDVNPVAHNLMQHFKTFKNLFGASSLELKSINGVGESVANLFQVISEIYKRAAVEEVVVRKLNTPKKITEYLKSLFAFEVSEKMYAVCLDSKHNLICSLQIARESKRSEANINVDEACRNIIYNNAKFVILAHNHLQDGVIPTQHDINITKQLLRRLYANGILICDHYIINNNDYFSFSQQGWFRTWREDYSFAIFNQLDFDKNMNDTISSGGVRIRAEEYNLIL